MHTEVHRVVTGYSATAGINRRLAGHAPRLFRDPDGWYERWHAERDMLVLVLVLAIATLRSSQHIAMKTTVAA